MNIPEIDCPERPYLDKDIEKINFLNKNYYKYSNSLSRKIIYILILAHSKKDGGKKHRAPFLASVFFSVQYKNLCK